MGLLHSGSRNSAAHAFRTLRVVYRIKWHMRKALIRCNCSVGRKRVQTIKARKRNDVRGCLVSWCKMCGAGTFRHLYVPGRLPMKVAVDNKRPIGAILSPVYSRLQLLSLDYERVSTWVAQLMRLVPLERSVALRSGPTLHYNHISEQMLYQRE